MLTKKEQKILEFYYNLKFSYIFLIIFTLVVASLYYYVILNKFIPSYLLPISEYETASVYVRSGMKKIVFASLFWISILIGVLFGNFFIHKRVKKILKKIISEQ